MLSSQLSFYLDLIIMYYYLLKNDQYDEIYP